MRDSNLSRQGVLQQAYSAAPPRRRLGSAWKFYLSHNSHALEVSVHQRELCKPTALSTSQRLGIIAREGKECRLVGVGFLQNHTIQGAFKANGHLLREY